MKTNLHVSILFLMVLFSARSFGQSIVMTQNTSGPAICDGVAYIDSTVSVSNTIWAGNGMIYQQGGMMLDSLCAGTYTLTYNSSNVGTSTTVTFVITAGSGTNPCTGFTAYANTTDATSTTLCDGTAQIVASGGTSPYTYAWTNAMMTTSTVSNLCPGTYNFCVTDANGCSTCSDAVINDASATTIDSVLIFTNNSYPGANVISSLTTSTIEDCTLDYSLVDSAGITNYTYLNQDTVLITWSLYAANGNVLIAYTLPYAIPSNATGVYSVTLIVFCSQKSSNYNTVQVTDQVYLNPAIMGLNVASTQQFTVNNPFNENLTVSFGKAATASYNLFDMNGKSMISGNVDNQVSVKLNTHSVPAGTYFLQVNVNGTTYTEKVIK
jgi:hypothetical protein